MNHNYVPFINAFTVDTFVYGIFITRVEQMQQESTSQRKNQLQNTILLYIHAILIIDSQPCSFVMFNCLTTSITLLIMPH